MEYTGRALHPSWFWVRSCLTSWKEKFLFGIANSPVHMRLLLFCMFCLWVSSSHMSLLHKWMCITSCWSWMSATKLHHWAKKGREDISACQDSYFWRFVGVFPVLGKDLSPEKQNSWDHLCHHIADVLRQIPSNLPVGSQTEILSIAQKWTSFHREVLYGHMHILFSFYPFWGWVGRGMSEILPLHFGCADWVSCWRWDESLGVVAASQHCMPSCWVFIWVVCWSQGTAFCLSKKAVQCHLILSCIKCTDCFMNHCSLLIQFLNRV